MVYRSEEKNATVVLGGDVMLGRSLVPFDEPQYLALTELFQQADVGFANLETTVRFPHEGTPNISPGSYMTTEPRLLDDLKWFGINLVSCANNHAFDFGEGGILSTCRHLDEAGIAHAGSGANLTLARRPAYVDTANGRVGLVAVSGTLHSWNRAGEARSDMHGRPGVNPLRNSTTYHAGPDQIAALGQLADDLGFRKESSRNRQHFFSESEFPAEKEQEVQFLGERFVVSDKPGMTTRADPRDMADNLRWISEARRQCDWLIVSVHSHEYGFASVRDARRRSDLSEPADFIVEFSRAAVDAGADIVAGHGSHTPLGIEIYRDKPIFYGLGNLIFHNDTMATLPADAYERFELDASATPADFQDTRTAGDTKGHPGDQAFWENVVAECTFETGTLKGIRLHPIDQAFGRPRSQRGRPVLAEGDVRERVAERLTALCATRGTAVRRGAGGEIEIDF